MNVCESDHELDIRVVCVVRQDKAKDPEEVARPEVSGW